MSDDPKKKTETRRANGSAATLLQRFWSRGGEPEEAPEPMISIAGIRGIVGSSIRPEEFFDYARAFMASLKPRRLVLGRDTRTSGEMLRHLVIAAAAGSGVEVHDLGVAPTPTVGLMVRELRAGGGIMISASHNPPEWNGLKFFSSKGIFISAEQYEALMETYRKREFLRATWSGLGVVHTIANPTRRHLELLLENLPVATIRRRRFKVVFDACNGSGAQIAQDLFRALHVEAHMLHAEPRGRFERKPEPLPANLSRLKRAVKRYRADVGFAVDPDADRLALVDETGKPLGEERTLTLAADYVLRDSDKAIVCNLSTTRAIDDVAERRGVNVERTPVGEAHVVSRMSEVGAAIGGEGNGGVILPAVHPGRDAATGMGLILALMASERRRNTEKPLSEINASIPNYSMIKDRVDLPSRDAIEPALKSLEENLDALAEQLPGGKKPKMDRTDGLKISFQDRWLHVRSSGTEPIMRLFAEAPTSADARGLIDWARQTLRM